MRNNIMKYVVGTFLVLTSMFFVFNEASADVVGKKLSEIVIKKTDKNSAKYASLFTGINDVTGKKAILNNGVYFPVSKASKILPPEVGNLSVWKKFASLTTKGNIGFKGNESQNLVVASVDVSKNSEDVFEAKNIEIAQADSDKKTLKEFVFGEEEQLAENIETQEAVDVVEPEEVVKTVVDEKKPELVAEKVISENKKHLEKTIEKTPVVKAEKTPVVTEQVVASEETPVVKAEKLPENIPVAEEKTAVTKAEPVNKKLSLPVPDQIIPMKPVEEGEAVKAEEKITGKEQYPLEAVPAIAVNSIPLLPVKVGKAAEHGNIVYVPLNKSVLVDIPEDVVDVVVSNPAVVDINKMTSSAYLLGRSIGSTNVIMLDGDGKVVSRMEVSVKLDVDALRDTFDRVIPGEQIEVSSVNDSIVLSGSVRSDISASNAQLLARRFVAADENVVNLLTVIGDQQVLLRVRVSEMNRTILKELGFQNSFQKSIDGASAYVLNWNSATSTGLNAGGLGQTGLYGGTLTKGNNFSSVFQALESTELVKTLAEPNLTAVSGETANLLAGGEYPIPIFDSDGNVSFTFRPYGISMAFSPVVLSSGRISLKMSVEVSAIAGTRVIANATVPEMTTRRFGTTVEMPSGGSLMIGGLLQNDVASTLGGVPGVKDVPVLGALFRSEAFQRNESELVVTISSFIVEPRDPNSFAAPTDGFVPSGDFDRILFGRLHEVYASSKKEPIAEAIAGPIGYIME